MATAGLLLAACAAGALLLGWLAEGEAQRRRGVELHGLARQAAMRLDNDMERRVSELTELVGSGAVGSLEEPQRLRGLVDGVKGNWDGYAWIGVASAAGRVIAASGALLEGVDVSARPWFQHGRMGLFTGDVHEAALLASRLRGPEGEPLRFVDIALPLSGEHGRPAGVLGAHIYWDWARQVGRSVLGPYQETPGLEILILSEDRQVLLGPHGLQGTLLETPLLADTAGAARAGEAPDPAASVQEWPNGQLYLSAAVEAPGEGSFHGLGWTVVAREPLANEARIAWDVFLTALAVGACFSMVLGGFTSLLVRRALTQGRRTTRPC